MRSIWARCSWVTFSGCCRHSSGAARGGPFELKYFCGDEWDLHDNVSASDVIVMITDQVSHAVRRRVLSLAASNRVSLYMRHSCGASHIKSCMRGLAVGR